VRHAPFDPGENLTVVFRRPSELLTLGSSSSEFLQPVSSRVVSWLRSMVVRIRVIGASGEDKAVVVSLPPPSYPKAVHPVSLEIEVSVLRDKPSLVGRRGVIDYVTFVGYLPVPQIAVARFPLLFGPNLGYR